MGENEIRQSQITSTYGTGAMVDFPNVSLMLCSPDLSDLDWGFSEESGGNPKQIKIEDSRLQKLFNVDYFVSPPIESTKWVGINSVRFPNTAYCPNCSTILKLNELEQQYPSDADHVKEKRNGSWYCPKCSNNNNGIHTLIQSRFIIATEYGLIDDFPWDWYCHRNPKVQPNRLEGGDGSCWRARNGQHLEIEFGSGGTSLSEIYVKCRHCKSKESLGPIFNSDDPVLMRPNYLWDRDGKLSSPWNGVDQNGNFHWTRAYVHPQYKNEDGAIDTDKLKPYMPRVLQRGAGNVYFPLGYTGFSLPKGYCGANIQEEGNSRNEEFLQHLNSFCTLIKTDVDEIPLSDKDKASFLIDHWSDFEEKWSNYSTMFGLNTDEFLSFLGSFQNTDSQLLEMAEDSRFDEFDCFTSKNIEVDKGEWYENEVVKLDDSNYPELSDWADKVVLLHKTQQLRISKGFTRVRPLAFDELILANEPADVGERKQQEYKRIVDVRKNPESTRWLPCTLVKGEGLLLVLSNDKLNEWESNELVIARAKMLSDNYRESLKSFNPTLTDDDINDKPARYILLHTLSHLIINGMANDCGYNAASLSEIIYCSESGDPKDSRTMNGILIHTSTPDAEGSLGGLIQMSKPERLQAIIRKSLENAKWCSSDPICIETKSGQGFMGVNLASCYACSMVPETSCETMNRFLDRGMLVGTLENPEIGFFKSIGYL